MVKIKYLIIMAITLSNSIKINRLIDELVNNRNHLSTMAGMTEEQARGYINNNIEQWVGSLLVASLKQIETNKKSILN